VATLRPSAAFAGTALDLTTVAPGARFGRIYHLRYPDPLGIGKTPSRFSDPRRRIPANRFRVLYLGSSLKVCFVEAMLRDQRNGAVADYPIEERELHERLYADVEVAEPLSLVDLRGDGLLRMGVPSDVARGARQRLARLWSVAFHTHPSGPDGILYPSRLNGETNLAVYDRAIPKLRTADTNPLIAVAGLAEVLNDLKVALA
jgi:RES domain